MKIISHKNNSYNTAFFLKNVYNTPYIDGVNLDIILTKDKKVVVFTPVINNIAIINTIKTNSLENLKSLDILTLEQVLSILGNTNKKIIINFLPIYIGEITESNLENIKELNKNYVNEVLNILNNFKSLNIYLCSINQSIVYFLKKLAINNKVGLVVSPDNISYINTDFYVLTSHMIDNKIIDEQLKNNKEIMISIMDCNDMNLVNTIYNKDKMNEIEKNIFESICFITNYPDIFYKLYK